MSMIDQMRNRNSGSEKKMPRAATLTPAPAPAAPAPYYDEEVLRVAQRDFDNKRMIAQLEAERDEWRRKYLTEKAERERLEALLAQEVTAHEQAMRKLCDERDARIAKLEQARDDYRVKLKEFETELSVGGNSLLDLSSGVAKVMHRLLEKIRTERETPDAAGVAGLAAVADAIDGDSPSSHVGE